MYFCKKLHDSMVEVKVSTKVRDPGGGIKELSGIIRGSGEQGFRWQKTILYEEFLNWIVEIIRTPVFGVSAFLFFRELGLTPLIWP